MFFIQKLVNNHLLADSRESFVVTRSTRAYFIGGLILKSSSKITLGLIIG